MEKAAASNFLGAVLLSRLFDTVGRVRMISGTYLISGILLTITGVILGSLTAVTLTLCGAVIFFFASAGASSAYLTVSEIFPMETRALCIAFFYAVGTSACGITGPLLFGSLIQNASDSGDITKICCRLRHRCRTHDRQRCRRGDLRRKGGAAVSGGSREAIDRGRRARERRDCLQGVVGCSG